LRISITYNILREICQQFLNPADVIFKTKYFSIGQALFYIANIN